MLPEIIKKEFEKIVMLYIADELTSGEKKYWDDILSRYPELNFVVEDYSKLMDIAEELPSIAVDDKIVKSTLDRINHGSSLTLVLKLKQFFAAFEFTPALRFAIVILFFVTGLLIVKNSNNSSEQADLELLLDWEGNSIYEKMERMDEKIGLIEAIDNGLADKKSWNEKINNIDQRIKYSADEQIFEINQSFIRNLSE